jgi:tRNA-specific 2-thiouridylase
LEQADRIGAEKIATGHHARVRANPDGGFSLLKGLDQGKDQSYFLCMLGPHELSRIVFPAGEHFKHDLREMLDKRHVPHTSKESQDACFLSGKKGATSLKALISSSVKLVPGEIRSLDGRVIGRHQGLPLYTLGQRKGIEIGGTGPYYAAGFDHKKNILYAVRDKDDEVLSANEMIVEKFNWIGGIEPSLPFSASVVSRYRQTPVRCVIRKGDSSSYVITLEKPLRAIATGQIAAVYDGDEVLGGGEISATSTACSRGL